MTRRNYRDGKQNKLRSRGTTSTQRDQSVSHDLQTIKAVRYLESGSAQYINILILMFTPADTQNVGLPIVQFA